MPSVKNAFQILMDIFGNEEYVYGGPQYIVQTNFGEAPKAAFDDPPKCLADEPGQLHHGLLPGRVQG